MTDRPIPFSPDMMRAVLREIAALGTGKTQTRRIPKLRGYPGFFQFGRSDTPGYDWTFRRRDHVWEDFRHHELLPRLQYAIGDRLWVREAWKADVEWDDTPPRELDDADSVLYLADGFYAPGMWGDPFTAGKYRPPMFMPRWASRVTLIVTDVKVERVQEISVDDAIAEGRPAREEFLSGRRWFRTLWDSLNAKRGFGWDANPWVIAVTFRPVMGNIDQIGEAA
ncbi:hypothetical protein LGQ03_07345 [Loktanella sp. TSTF-M6]|uniref:ASCH domain-containing protein n=1 Tax=Loktanella gaetbuli TaxID=2881335 RepID=A0ABS8BU61_9RHOB|nr:hypothetical protein [Loktanella gaetbuli]MCB5199051.1 hypothetical protein [Loktanella gaetbuli]